MKLKSLILGSAAALVAATGARAADAIIAEPEPVEYVRVCDMYGVGFFYIPGTETCFRIGGEIRYEIRTNGYRDSGDTTGRVGSVPSGTTTAHAVPGWQKASLARFYLDAREETEMGTLRGYMRFSGTRTDGVNGVSTDKAYITIGGLKLGYDDSAWVFSPNGGLSGYGTGSDNGGYYGFQRRHMIQYNWLGTNGVFATISLEHDGPLAGSGYAPDVVGRLGVSQGWGAAWIVGGYDESFAGGGFGLGTGLHINIPNMPGSAIRIRGFYSDGDHAYGTGGPNVSPTGLATGNLYGNAEWSIMASYRHQLTSTVSILVGGQYLADLYLTGTAVNSGFDAWGAELALVWDPVANLQIRTEIFYDEVNAPGIDGTLSGFLRFTRYF